MPDLSKEVMTSPLLNARSGTSYEASEIRRWVREHGSDGLLPELKTADADLVPNRVLAAVSGGTENHSRMNLRLTGR